MDDFLTPGEQAVREKARGYFRHGSSASAAGPARALPGDARDIWREAGLPWGEACGPGGLFMLALVIEEASAASPELGRALLAAAPSRSGTGGVAGELAWALGSAAAALEAGLAAARGKGLFQSTLMGHQQAQGDLADAFSAVQALRLKAYRALRLIDRGESARGEDELGRAAGEAGAVRNRALALAGALRGEGGPGETTPEKERSGR